MTFSNECNYYGNCFEHAVLHGFYSAVNNYTEISSFSYILTLVAALRLQTLNKTSLF